MTTEGAERSIRSKKSGSERALTSCLPAEADAAAPIRHVYLHIPFCARICPYCAFYKDLLDRRNADRFCAAILRELAHHLAGRPVLPQTIFLGGGTPTALNISQLKTILQGFSRQLDLSELTEWTIEANPGSVSARKAALLKQFGVNRISLGVQSWDDGLLTVLGREHNARQAEESFRVLREAGFSNINVDLMFGLPGQTAGQWEATLAKTIELRPEHISAYCLTYEEDTEFFLRHTRGEYRSNTDAENDFFELAMSMLQGAGYEHYEISNYAQHGYASVHNRAYWAGYNHLGIGPSAFSTVGLLRWQNIPDYREYADRVLSDQPAIHFTEELTPEMKMIEKIALGLRTAEGIRKDLLTRQSDKIEDLVRLGLLQTRNGNVVLTRKGKSLADSVAEELI